MFSIHSKLFRRLAMAMAVVFGISNTLATTASAGMVGTDQIVTQTQVADARATIDGFMARDDVQQKFESLGVDPAEAETRVAALSDAEAVDLAKKIDEMPAGQGALGAIVGAAVLIFIVLLITDLLGFTHVFGFTNKGSANPA